MGWRLNKRYRERSAQREHPVGPRPKHAQTNAGSLFEMAVRATRSGRPDVRDPADGDLRFRGRLFSRGAAL